jgi:hypothetical protein
LSFVITFHARFWQWQMTNGKWKMENENTSKSLSGRLTRFSIIDPHPRRPYYQVRVIGPRGSQAVVRSTRGRDQTLALQGAAGQGRIERDHPDLSGYWAVAGQA